MKIKNKKTGYIFEISDKEAKTLLIENDEEFEAFDKKDAPIIKKPKTIREKIMGTDCLKALTKNQIKQELDELEIEYDSKAKKDELVELLKKSGGY